MSGDLKYGRHLVERITTMLHRIFVIYDSNIEYPLFYNSSFQKKMYMFIKNIWLVLEGVPYLPPNKKVLIEFKYFQSKDIIDELNKYIGLYDNYYRDSNGIKKYELEILEYIHWGLGFVLVSPIVSMIIG